MSAGYIPFNVKLKQLGVFPVCQKLITLVFLMTASCTIIQISIKLLISVILAVWRGNKQIKPSNFSSLSQDHKILLCW